MREKSRVQASERGKEADRWLHLQDRGKQRGGKEGVAEPDEGNASRLRIEWGTTSGTEGGKSSEFAGSIHKRTCKEPRTSKRP